MLTIDTANLNQTEQLIHKKLPLLIQESPNLKILDAAELCGVSSSKISKYIKKLGFENFKQFKLYFSGQELPVKQKHHSHEIDRIKNYLEKFDLTVVERFINTIKSYPKIILFGLGPSYFCLEYFAYKLNFISEKKVYVTQDERSVELWADPNALIIIFSVTGAFTNFDSMAKNVKEKGGKISLVIEEYNPNASQEIENIFYLTDSTQGNELLAHEKTRTIFFIFIEEVISKFNS